MGFNLARRRHQAELMDQPGLDPTLHQAALRGLERINWFSRSARIVWQEIRSLARLDPTRTWKVLDVASGGGDVALAVARQARRERLSLGLCGVDVSPTAIQHAQRQAAEAD